MKILRPHLIAMLALPATIAVAQNVPPFLSSLTATKASPLFTTYAAALERSEFILDEGYHFRFYDSTGGADFSSAMAGDICVAFERNSRLVYRLDQLFREPVITTSYSDLVCFCEYPYDDVRVDATFLVKSSRAVIYDLRITNLGQGPLTLTCLLFVRSATRLFEEIAVKRDRALFVHQEVPDDWMREHAIPFEKRIRNVLLAPEGSDGVFIHQSAEISGLLERPSSSVNTPCRSSRMERSDSARVVGFRNLVSLRKGESKPLRLVRYVSRAAEPEDSLVTIARACTHEDLRTYITADERLYAKIPSLRTNDTDLQMLYWSAFSLLRQVMLPPEGMCHYNYYVFSREPKWGWGHGGQVFHESLSMLAYALMDPQSAMNSQRVYFERQKPNGYINYRTGPYLDENIPYEGDVTTSAPWFAWENWETYLITRDRSFLQESYVSSAKFYRYVALRRDPDGDGLCEWGGHAVLESVRDGLVAVWDQVGWPSKFVALDLNCMLVSEARALASMAKELGLDSESLVWSADADARSGKINAEMWDEQTGFYYHVDRKTHTFSFAKPDDLKRKEIIGFLPLWAGVADSVRAAKLVAHLTDPSRFWRSFGIPSLAADDPYYNPRGYWNGPVWVEWNYLIVRGLQRYGYRELARELTRRVASAMIVELKKSHNLWEFYSPDQQWAGYHATYIWAGLIARMLRDVSLSVGH